MFTSGGYRTRKGIAARLLCLTVFVTVALVLGCDDEKAPMVSPDGAPPSGKLLATYGCKLFTDTKLGFAPSDKECLSWEYDGESVLSLKHQNAGFNCCPDEITAQITIDGNVIRIVEDEDMTSGGCYCLCLFDVNYEIEHLAPGEYQIIILGPYMSVDWGTDGVDSIEFTVDISAMPTGFECIQRNHYPWHVFACPDGRIVNATGCKEFSDGNMDYFAPEDQDCIAYEYDGEGLLQLTHINAGLNCCPIIVADIDVVGSTIIIEEIDSLDNGGCDCLCLFDIDYEITNLLPGEYTVKVIEPYRHPDDDILEFTVDFITTPTGSFCVPRSHYPWAQ